VNFIVGFREKEALGINRVQHVLLRALEREHDVELNMICLSLLHSKLKYPAMYTVFPSSVWWKVCNDHAAIAHIASHYYAHILNFIPLKRSVVTCYDLIELMQMESRQVSYRWHRRKHIQAAVIGMLKAKHIITISEYTKKRILEKFLYPEDRITVIYPALDRAVFFPRPIDHAKMIQYGLDESARYVLYVGSEQRRKNLRTLIAAFSIARQKISDLKLLKVGSHQTEAGRKQLLSQIKELGLESDFQLIDYVNDCDLPYIYSAASVFVFPSLLEGFGLPVLEAMACGVPVVTSDAASIPEVAGEAALLVDPLDADSLADSIIQVVLDDSAAREMSAKGIAQAQKFTLERAASKTLKVYRKLLDL